MSADRQNRIEHHNALLRPLDQITVVRDVTPEIIVKLLVDIYEGRRDLNSRLHGKRESVSLPRLVVRVLSQNDHLHLIQRCKMEGIKNVPCRRIYCRRPVLLIYG